jgi:hypothetical protein
MLPSRGLEGRFELPQPATVIKIEIMADHSRDFNENITNIYRKRLKCNKLRQISSFVDEHYPKTPVLDEIF